MWLDMCVNEVSEGDKDWNRKKCDKKFPNMMSSVHPEMRETTNQLHLVTSQSSCWKYLFLKKFLIAAKDERSFYTQENKDINIANSSSETME